MGEVTRFGREGLSGWDHSSAELGIKTILLHRDWWERLPLFLVSVPVGPVAKALTGDKTITANGRSEGVLGLLVTVPGGKMANQRTTCSLPTSPVEILECERMPCSGPCGCYPLCPLVAL